MDSTMEHAREFAGRNAGNWLKWSSCFMNSPGEFEEDWFFFEPEHRDSDALERANTEVFRRELEQFTHGDDPDVIFTTVSCWAYGWRTQFRVRMFTRGAEGERGDITAAAQVVSDLFNSLEDYPVLDEELYSRMEYEEWLKNFSYEVHYQYRRGFTAGEVPEDEIVERALEWAHENEDIDHASYPEVEMLLRCLRGIGCKEDEE